MILTFTVGKIQPLLCLMNIVKIACERDDCSFIFVEAVFRFKAPFFNTIKV